MMQRRSFLTLLGGAAAAWPLAASAQQRPTMPVIGFLFNESPAADTDWVRAFHQGLSQSGFVEGRNVAIEQRGAENQVDRLPALAADLVRRPVNVIVVGSNPGALAAKAATTTVPIVFQIGGDPVALGLVASLSRPGGNVTGVTSLNTELVPKKLEVLHELLPAATRMALLVNPASPVADTQVRDAQAAARLLGLQLHVLHASTEHDLDAVFASLGQLRAGALAIAPSPFFVQRSEQLAALALRHAVPAIFQWREFALAGGLMSYGADPRALYRIVGAYTGRILKGEKPSDLPVQQATRVELVINMKTAKALGLTFPITLLGRADEVIE
jgi:putative ABC transport system substrate-binding protein